MTDILLDTNVLSELTRPVPAPAVIDFLAELDQGWLSAITLYELLHGARLNKARRKSSNLLAWIELLQEQYRGYILPVDTAIADQAAHLRARCSSKGRALHVEDALIAATAIQHDLPLATRDRIDFEGTGVLLINPWA